MKKSPSLRRFYENLFLHLPAKKHKEVTFATNNLKVVRVLVFAVVFTSCLFGCGPEVVFEEKKNLGGLWTYADNKTFGFEIKDTMPAHDIILEVEHATDFTFQNIYTMVKTVFPDQKTAKHQVSLNLTDSENRWVGDCNEKFCTTEILLSENIFFNKLGKYEITVEQYGRKDSLSGVESLNLKVIHHQKN